MLIFTLAISLDHFQFTLIHGPNILSSYAILFFMASDFAFITRNIYNWVLLPLWPSRFVSSVSTCLLLFSSSILGTYQPGEFILQCYRNWLWVKLGLALVGKVMLSKSLIQFSADGWGCVPVTLTASETTCLISQLPQEKILVFFFGFSFVLLFCWF